MSHASPLPPEPTPVASDLRGPAAVDACATRLALAWVGAYLVVAGLWIVGSDAWVARQAVDIDTLRQLQVAKGLAFVVLTAAVMYVAVRQTVRHRERQRQRLSALEGRWAHLMGALDQVVWFASPDARRIDHVSEAARKVYGRPPADFIERPALWLSIVHPEDHDRVAASHVRLGGLDHGDIEYRIRHADGGWRWVRARTWLLRDEHGQAVALGGVVDDITPQRRALELAEARQQQLAGIVETAMDAILTIDAQQRIVVFNSAAARIFRLPAEQAIGQPLDRFIPEVSRAAHREHVRRFAQTGASSRHMGGAGGLRVLTGLRADGEPFPLEASIARFGHGDDVLMTVVLRDVTALQQAEAARQAQLEAEAASRAKTEFLSRMSHELRTPLNAMLGFAQILDADAPGRLSPQQHEQLGHILQAGWHLLRLINDVLDVSRIEAGRLELQRENCELHPALDEALRLCSTQAREAGIALRAEHAGAGPLRAWCDPTRLLQVLLNLLSNAIKYNRRGGWVRTALSADAQVVHIDVEDNGLGISPEQMAHLFEPFNRLGRERGAAEGTGIGLVLSRELVERMGGRLDIDSGAARGTRARITLPRAPLPDGSTAWPQPLRRALPGPSEPAASAVASHRAESGREVTAGPCVEPRMEPGVVPGVAPPVESRGEPGAEPQGEPGVEPGMDPGAELGVESCASAAALAGDAPRDEARPQPPAAPAAVRGRVLSVEDNPVNQLLVQQLLARLPQVELIEADSGQQALQQARAQRPDLILLDLHLPDMDGTDWLDAARQDARLAGIPVVALSASALQEDVRAALAHGAREYWTKPLDFDRFLAGVSRLLARG